MSVKHLDHLNLTVGDYRATVDWYRRVFGFDVVEEAVDERGVRWGVIRAGEALLCIYEHSGLELADCDTERRMGRHALCHLGLRIDDRSAWEATIASEGLEVLHGGEVRWPHSTAWYVRDPTGWEIEVVLWNEDRIRFD